MFEEFPQKLSRSWGRWHARSVGNPPHRSQCPGVSSQYVLYTAFNAVLTCFKGRLPRPAGDPIWRCFGAMLALFFALGRFLTAFCVLAAFVLVSGRCFLHLGALHGRFWRGQGRSGEGFGGSNGLFFQVFSCFRMHARWRCAKTPDVQKPQFFPGFS